MKSIIILLACLSVYCHDEPLLGGWKTSDDNALKQECLKKALVSIPGTEVGSNVESQVSDYICKTQIVNGLNIKCSFTLHGQAWQCSYYQSFTQNHGIQLNKCEPIPVPSNDKQGFEQRAISDEDDEDEQVAQRSPSTDDEAEIDALYKPDDRRNINSDEDEEEQ